MSKCEHNVLIKKREVKGPTTPITQYTPTYEETYAVCINCGKEWDEEMIAHELNHHFNNCELAI